MLQEKLKIRVIESYYGLYQNLLYLIKKSISEKYRLVNIVVELNRVTIQDANLSSSADKFSEKFASYIISSLINFFSSYDQVELDKES